MGERCLSPLHTQVVQVPTNKPLIRSDLSPRLYFDPMGRVSALCRIVESCWENYRFALEIAWYRLFNNLFGCIFQYEASLLLSVCTLRVQTRLVA
jgi:hypothetical protein